MLTRDKLLSRTKATIREFEFNGERAYCKSLPVSEVIAARGLPDSEQTIALVVKSLCDADGVPLLEDGDEQIVRDLQNADDFNTLVNEVLAVTGLGRKGFEEVAKN